MAQSKSKGGKYVPGSEARPEEVFAFPYLVDEKAAKFLTDHGRVMFIIRGPPGTGKSTLSSMISKKYRTAVVCSADSYFSQAFVKKIRSRDTLKESHLFCQRRVKEECERGTHPLVVQNTHIRRWEVEVYLKFAAEYGYTVIMAITLRKFVAEPEILERTNKKGLTKDYLERRMSRWEENIPLYIGWFLCPDDESFVFEQAKYALGNLLGDGKLCKELNVFCEDEIWEYFKLESQLFCIATYCNHGKVRGTYHFYLSDPVQEAYGKCFDLSIHGFLVSPDLVLAVVAVTEDMKLLMQKSSDGKGRHAEDLLCSGLENLSIQDTKSSKKRGTFRKDFSSSGKTAELHDYMEGELMNKNYMSFIIIAHATKSSLITDTQKFAAEVFSEITNSQGIIENSIFSELDNGTKYYRLPHSTWLISLAKKITLSTVFTGLYT